MGPIQKSKATLRISGDDLEPEEITRILGTLPTRARAKGKVWVTADTDRQFSAKAHTGQWHLETSVREPADLDGQVQSSSASWRRILTSGLRSLGGSRWISSADSS
jgi:hypothetical protein